MWDDVPTPAWGASVAVARSVLPTSPLQKPCDRIEVSLRDAPFGDLRDLRDDLGLRYALGLSYLNHEWPSGPVLTRIDTGTPTVSRLRRHTVIYTSPSSPLSLARYRLGGFSSNSQNAQIAG